MVVLAGERHGAAHPSTKPSRIVNTATTIATLIVVIADEVIR